jgi:hypothetical protein
MPAIAAAEKLEKRYVEVMGEQDSPITHRLLYGDETLTAKAIQALDGLVDRAGQVPALRDALVENGDPAHVFRTVEKIPGGTEWLEHLEAYLEEYGYRCAGFDLRAFRADNAYVWQLRHMRTNTRLRYYLYAREIQRVDAHGWFERLGEDGMFGAVAFDFASLPTVSRDLLDSVNELTFLDRHLGVVAHEGLQVLDIGAGYGRLAHRAMMALPKLGSWYCIDAIPESTFLCEYYLAFRGCLDRTAVVALDEIDDLLHTQRFDLAVNVHSFSEMTAEAASRKVKSLSSDSFATISCSKKSTARSRVPGAFRWTRKSAVQARSQDLSRPSEPQTRPIPSFRAATSCSSTRARTG